MNERVQLIKELTDSGFRFHRTAKHSSLFKDEHGLVIGLSHTPSDYRNAATVRAEIKRALANRPPSPPEPIKESKTMAENYIVVPKRPTTSWTGPQDHPDVKPQDPAIVAGRKQCKVCREFFPVESYRLAGPTRSPVSTCNGCSARRSADSRMASRRENAAKEAQRLTAASRKVSESTALAAQFKDERLKDEANSAVPIAFTQPTIFPTTAVAPPKERKATTRLPAEPEMMAQRVLISRHKEEYDAILTDMLAALGWDK